MISPDTIRASLLAETRRFFAIVLAVVAFSASAIAVHVCRTPEAVPAHIACGAAGDTCGLHSFTRVGNRVEFACRCDEATP
jgi:hypothetical protein